MIRTLRIGLVALAAALLLPAGVGASTIFWTDWTAFTAGNTTGTATGSIATSNGNVGVSYSGQVGSNSNTNNVAGGVSWGPASTFSGGNVSNPPPIRDIITLTGGTATALNTLTFLTPVLNPAVAIWSLGAPGTAASFVFTQPGPNPAIQSGGPSNEFGGITITSAANIVNGNEGNGTIQFIGIYTQLTWMNPQFENFYGFTVGVENAVGPALSPEPGTYVMLITGLLALGILARKGAHV